MKFFKVGLVSQHADGTRTKHALEHFQRKESALAYVEQVSEGLTALLAESVGDPAGKMTVEDVLAELGVIGLAHELEVVEPADGSAIIA